MPLLIRPATPSDAPSLSSICLLTGSAGSSAEAMHAYGELPGLVYALPYVNVGEWAWGFVLVDTGDEKRVVGYILGASDTRKFEEEAEKTWYPPLRLRYPLSPSPSSSSPPSSLPERKEADTRYIKLLHSPESAPEACVKFSPAHMHIDLLPEVQRKGWGKRLVGFAVGWLRGLGKLEGVWLGLDPKNEGARRFYERLGFEGIEGAPGNCMGLKFESWRG
ncbi:uncharacterized protein STEHIDRAFT_130337 [Stereum hirsutum FP-91666 SS1]|uniref:uncharacterized protein n=1 Tax=Stereum hirsutum (strain FP-91666) TaxID=721885 RepID=UPI000440D5E2|nr:uncharacterized protein STEHIDRAFT_130337 [Stereum hirsutum FP-91666 SS1]EIM88409.1 hypothetical protein STEHIDRAFT_130337 [Stereum hirsutum FP-91666 SS1]